MKMLVVDITAAEGDLVATRSPSGARTALWCSFPETVEEIVTETADRPLISDEFLDALDRLSAASSQQAD